MAAVYKLYVNGRVVGTSFSPAIAIVFLNSLINYCPDSRINLFREEEEELTIIW